MGNLYKEQEIINILFLTYFLVFLVLTYSYCDSNITVYRKNMTNSFPAWDIKDIETRERTEYIIIHCSATKPSSDIGVSEIDAMHKERGWDGVGYHYIIRRNGLISCGRDLMQVGAHAKTYNIKSIGICLIGGVDDNLEPCDNFTAKQITALRWLIERSLKLFPGAKVIAHNEVADKACPSFDVKKYWPH